jgi:hypothetical protein
VGINNRLLACKAERDKLYNYVKPALRVSPYFQVLALPPYTPRSPYRNLILRFMKEGGTQENDKGCIGHEDKRISDS